jgi:hypothetical protein
MRPNAGPVIIVFFAAGLGAAAVSLLLGWLFLPLLFITDGLVLLLFLGSAYILCRSMGWVSPALKRRRYFEAAALLVIGYPAAELFGTLLALICEGVLLLTPTAWHSAHEPHLWIGLLAFWGTVAAAIAVNTALMVITDRWDSRSLLLLLGAGVLTTIVALRVYLPNYGATEGFAARYRELVLFGVLLPLGNALYSVLAGYGLMRRAPDKKTRAVVAEN